MQHIQCPQIWQPSQLEDFRKSLFLGGGITGCEEWQDKMVEQLADTDLILLNPRRADFDVNDPKATEFQIEWEFVHLRKARARLFWFSSATLCPITLFELGRYSISPDPLFVGVDPEYKRRQDVEVQLRLARPDDCQVVYSLEELAKAVKRWTSQHEF